MNIEIPGNKNPSRDIAFNDNKYIQNLSKAKSPSELISPDQSAAHKVGNFLNRYNGLDQNPF